jgi:hypothetical protein
MPRSVSIVRAEVRSAFLIAAVAVSASGAQHARPVRVATTYSIIGPRHVDTTEATRRFTTGLVADSLVRVLPPNSPEAMRAERAAGKRVDRLETAESLVLLSVSGTSTRGNAHVRVMEVATARVAFRDSLPITDPQTLGDILDSLGRRVAREIAARQSAKRPPLEH